MATKRNKYNSGHISFSPMAAMQHLREEAARKRAESGEDIDLTAGEYVDTVLQQRLTEAKETIDHLRDQVMRLEETIREMRSSTEWKPGWVYLIKESSNGHYKIGKTTNIDDRLHTFNVKLPFKVEFICTIRAKNYHQLEKDLHDMFVAKHVNGEWFALDAADVTFIQSLAQEG